jgi:hypothetical protein
MPDHPEDGDPFWEDEPSIFDCDDEDEYEDCGLMPDGQCSKAGSEECDWICGALHEDDDA